MTNDCPLHRGALMPKDHEVELANETILLRAFRPEDADELYAAVRESMVALGQWLSWCHADYSIQDTIEFLGARGDAFQKDAEHGFVICERSSGRLLGGVGINQLEKAARRANLGYWLRTSATRRGIAAGAVRLVATWAFESLGLERLEIVAATGNHASQRVAERVGATREGIARRRLRVHGVQHDAFVYSLVQGDILKP
jgi:ribosomal-protein-serine acetyltransferase